MNDWVDFAHWLRGAVEPSMEAKQWTGDDDRPMPSVESPADEELREAEWHELSALARDFAVKHGNAAMLRCVSIALERK